MSRVAKPVDFHITASHRWLGGNDWAVLVLESGGAVAGDQAITWHAEEHEAGRYLEGANHNAGIVKDYFLRSGIPNVQMEHYDFNCRQTVPPKQLIAEFLARNNSRKRFIYFTGHGSSSGSWCFTMSNGSGKHDCYIRVQDMVNLINEHPSSAGMDVVFSQSCHSGHWCYQTAFNVICSASPEQSSVSTASGSLITKAFFGKAPHLALPQKSSPSCNFGNEFTPARGYNCGICGRAVGGKGPFCCPNGDACAYNQCQANDNQPIPGRCVWPIVLADGKRYNTSKPQCHFHASNGRLCPLCGRAVSGVGPYCAYSGKCCAYNQCQETSNDSAVFPNRPRCDWACKPGKTKCYFHQCC